MTYLEACEATVTRKEAEREIAKHQCSFNEFLQDVGDREEYTGDEILGWLGY